jgi:outer membrane receptor protein involved in Fe transport
VAAIGSPGQPGYVPAVTVTLPTTIAGVNYQYRSHPVISAGSDYNNLFPSGSAKYLITQNLQAQFGYSHTIRRPNYNQIGGTVAIDDTNLILNVPVQSLEPEISDNYTARLAYYFEPAGSFTITGTENRLKHANITTDTPAANTGYADEFPGYDVRSYGNAIGVRVVKSLTIGYNQTLTLPGIFKRTTVFANYTRLVQDDALKYGNAPRSASGGVSWKFREINLGVNAKWTDDTPWNFAEGRYRRHRIMEDVNAGYQLTKNFNLFLSGRNITNQPDYVYENRNPSLIQKIEHYGSIWTFGVSGKF